MRSIADEVIACSRCPRLVTFRESAGEHPPPRFSGDSYWSKPLPGFGSEQARVVVVGLAPAAHGANRTGRMFTGDRSGDWLYRALNRAGFANQAESVGVTDGLELNDCYVTAVVRCAPPKNRPTPLERDTCLEYLVREIRALKSAQVIVALGGFAWDGVLRVLRSQGSVLPRPRPKFGHLAEVNFGTRTLLGSYHPSQQNTFTGKLSEKDLDRVFVRVRKLLNGT